MESLSDEILKSWVKSKSKKCEEKRGETVLGNDIWCETCGLESCHVEEGYLVCHGCSVAKSATLDSGAEWRHFSSESGSSRRQGDPSRVGMPVNPLMPHSGTGSVIESRMRESFQMRRIRKFHHWSTLNFRGRNLIAVFEKLQSIAKRNGIPTVIIEKSKMLFKKVNDLQLFRGENKEGLVATCIYRACKDFNVPRSVKEIAEIFDIDEQKMTRGNKCFSKAFDEVDEMEISRLSISKPADFIERFSCKLNIPENLYMQICKVAQVVESINIVADHAASSVAAALLFYLSEKKKLGITKSAIAQVSLISEVTIGKCYKKLVKYETVISCLI